MKLRVFESPDAMAHAAADKAATILREVIRQQGAATLP